MSNVVAGISVRRLRGSDEAAVLQLLTATLGDGPSEAPTSDFLTWKHQDNPFGASPCLVAEDNGRIVGVRLFLRWRLQIGDQAVKAVRAVDTATDPAYRGQGIFKRLTLDLLGDLERSGEVDLVFNTPNANSRPGYLKMGWQQVGRLPVRLAPIRPLRLLRGARAASRSTASARTVSMVGARPPSRPSCPFETAADVLSKRPEDVRRLLAGLERPRALHTPKSMEYLLWRYADAPGLDYRCVTLEDASGLRGLAFGRMRDRAGLTEYTISDVIVGDGDTDGVARLLRLARGSGADHATLHAQQGSLPDAVAMRAGFLTVPRIGIGLLANPRRPIGVDPLQPHSWRLSLGDLEVF